MPFLPGLAVVFVGITGGDHHHRVEQQIQVLLQEYEVVAKPLSSSTVRSLARHDKASTDIVRRLHVDGVVGGELVSHHGRTTLRLVVYSADGSLRSLTETALTGIALPRDAVAVLSSNLGDEVTALNEAAATREKTAPVATRRAKH